MKKARLSKREIVMLVFLVVLVLGMVYYLGFYTPLQEEIDSINKQKSEVEAQIAVSMQDVAAMNAMQAELDEILSRPEEEITEIAPYDNKEVVLNQLYLILDHSEQYILTFVDPVVAADGTVRRDISMEFHCRNYESAKTIIKNLTNSHWRCLVSNLAIEGDSLDVESNPVSVTATITFFEHTDLK